MKKICQKYFAFLSATMLLPFNINVLSKSIGDSHNVEYGEFVELSDSQCGTTELETGILEYTVTFPKKVDKVPYRQKLRKLGSVTVKGKAFIKPYKVAVSISKQDFKLVSRRRAENKRDQIPFEVVRVEKDKGGDLKNEGSLLGKTHYYYRNDKTNDAYQKNAYLNGDIADINQSMDVGIWVKDTDWKKASPGKYKGKITFFARLDNKDIF